jgi:acyl-CoA synthetase (AMP-forming)/AMP-acid ligase II
MLPRNLLARCAQNFPNKVAYYCGNRSATWSQMDRRADQLAAGLQQLGVSQGDTVAILTHETIEVYEHFFACMKIGAVRVSLNWRYAEEEMRHVLKDSSAKVVIVQARCRETIEPLLPELVKAGVLVVGYGGDHGLELDYESVVERGRDGAPRYPGIAPDDALFISYTSGTSGVPKGVVLTHLGLHDAIIQDVVSTGFTSDDVWYVPGASAWIVVVLNLWGLANGMTHVLPDGDFELTRFLRDIARYRVTTVFMVPTIMRWAAREYRSGKYDLSSVRLILFGSSPSSPALVREIKETFGCDLMHTYTLTEASGAWVSLMTPKDIRDALTSRPERLRSIGRCRVHFEVSIRGDDGTELAPNESGELWVRGVPVMKEYLNLPEKTAEVFPGDGWLKTNDIASRDEDGFIYLHDRRSFLIITGAVNVFPSSVEAVLSLHEDVEEVAVVGVPHPEWGEVVVAVVKGREDSELTQATLLEVCEGRLSKPEIPKLVLFVDEPLPKTLSSKLRKKDIRSWVLDNPSLVPWSMEEA